MSNEAMAVITTTEERRREEWSDPVHGRFSWFTLFDSAFTESGGLTAGVAEFAPGEGGREHRHEQPEMYYLLEGIGALSMDGHEQEVRAGTAVYIPSNSLHTIRNRSGALLRVLYVFPADGIADVIYRYPD